MSSDLFLEVCLVSLESEEKSSKVIKIPKNGHKKGGGGGTPS